MESKAQPEILLKRKVCESCREAIVEFDLDIQTEEKYTCISCSTA